MKKNRIKFLIIELFLLMLAVFFVWKIFDQNVTETRIAVILPESGDKRWDALIKGMKQAAAENNVHMIICNTEEIDGPEAEREFIREQKDNDIDGFIIYPAPGHETENMLKKECGNKPYLLMADSLAVKEGEAASPAIQPDYREIGRRLGEQLKTKKQKIGIILEGEQHGYYDPDNHDDYYVAMKNKTEVDCETTLYPISEAVDVAKWTYHHMDLDLKPEIEEILGHKYKGTYHEPVNSVEFVPMGVNKAKGIERILEHTGISRDDSYAFGDSANDIDMIQYVKYGTAMGNSVPELLEIAPYKTARADEDGIEKGLKKFGLI